MEFVLSRRNGLMTRVGVFVRLLMLVACLVPFTSPRQAAAALAPTPPATPVPATPTPTPLQEEEDTEREEEAAGKDKARTSPPPTHRPSVASAQALYAHPFTPPGTSSTSCPSPVDPFRNGLGCPFRC
jgi:hypothetical protein